VRPRKQTATAASGSFGGGRTDNGRPNGYPEQDEVHRVQSAHQRQVESRDAGHIVRSIEVFFGQQLRMRWSLIVICVITLAILAVFGPGRWAEYQYWYSHEQNGAIKAQAISAVVQAAAAVILLMVTAYYAYVTRRTLDTTQRQANTAQQQFELGQRQFKLAQAQFEFSRQQAESAAKDLERQLKLAETQAALTEKQLKLAREQFTASMIPKLFLKVYPALENARIIHWEVRNVRQHDLHIQNAEIRWAMPGREWTHILAQYPGGVFAPNEELSSRHYNAILIPDEHWPKSNMAQDEVVGFLTLSLTVSDVAKLLSFRFEFTPGKGQNVTVVETLTP